MSKPVKVYALKKFGDLISLHQTLEGAKRTGEAVRDVSEWREFTEFLSWIGLNDQGGEGAMTIEAWELEP